MKRQNKKLSQFINPNNQNRRCFNMYFTNNNDLNLNYMKSSQQKQQKQHEHFLDNVSLTSSIRIRENPYQIQEVNRCPSRSQKVDAHFVVSNKRKIDCDQNPEIYDLISKHIESYEVQKMKNQSSDKNNTDFSSSDKFKTKSFSIEQIKKTPKITEFSRQTFYRQFSTSRQSNYSNKQKQDNLHSNINLEVNASKISLCKRTVPFKQKNRFLTLEVYILNKRIGVEVGILAGKTKKQIKFRLIMNQIDTKTFHKFWSTNIEDFLLKCLDITDNGISLKVGMFNSRNQSKEKSQSSQLKQTRKSYLKNYESFVRKQMNQKHDFIKVRNFRLGSEYNPLKKKIIYDEKITEINQEYQQSKQIFHEHTKQTKSSQILVKKLNEPQSQRAQFNREQRQHPPKLAFNEQANIQAFICIPQEKSRKQR